MDDGQKEMMKDKEIVDKCFSFKTRLWTWEKICDICFLVAYFNWHMIFSSLYLPTRSSICGSRVNYTFNFHKDRHTDIHSCYTIFLTAVITLIPSLILFVFVYFLNDSHSGCTDIQSQYVFNKHWSLKALGLSPDLKIIT